MARDDITVVVRNSCPGLCERLFSPERLKMEHPNLRHERVKVITNDGNSRKKEMCSMRVSDMLDFLAKREDASTCRKNFDFYDDKNVVSVIPSQTLLYWVDMNTKQMFRRGQENMSERFAMSNLSSAGQHTMTHAVSVCLNSGLPCLLCEQLLTFESTLPNRLRRLRNRIWGRMGTGVILVVVVQLTAMETQRLRPFTLY